jgi:hypothetical protein
MIYEIKKINVWSVVKIGFIPWGIFGFLMGLIYTMFTALLFTVFSPLVSEFGAMPADFAGMSILFVFVMSTLLGALFFAVIGTVFTALFTWIYNLLANILGGIKFHLNQEKVVVVAEPSQRSEAESEGMLGNQRYE